MASSNGNGKYSSDHANAVAATFGPKDKQLAAIEAAYAGAETEAERDEVRQAVLDHLDPSMGRARIKALHRAVGVMDPHEVEQVAQQSWDEQFPVILPKPVNTEGAQLQRQIAAAEDKRRLGIKPYDDLGYFVTEVRRLHTEQKVVNDEFEQGPMAAYLAQQAEMEAFSRQGRERFRGRTLDDAAANGVEDGDVILVPDHASEGDIAAMQHQMNAARDKRLAATPGVKEMREAKSPEELTRILAGMDGIGLESKGHVRG